MVADCLRGKILERGVRYVQFNKRHIYQFTTHTTVSCLLSKAKGKEPLIDGDGRIKNVRAISPSLRTPTSLRLRVHWQSVSNKFMSVPAIRQICDNV